MDVTTALRPAQKFFTAGIVAAATATCLVSVSAGHSALSPSSHVQAKKEYVKQGYSRPGTKQLRNTPAKKEYAVQAKKEYKVTPGKKEYILSAKKEYKVTPTKKEYSATA